MLIIYGAGYLAKNYYFQIRDKEKVFCFATTDESNGNYFLGIPIICIENLLHFRETAQIRIAANDNNANEIIKNLRRLGFHYYEKASVNIKNYDYYSKRFISDPVKEIVDWYELNTGKWIDIMNPKTFNEKIQWMKLFDCTSIKTVLSDKLMVRDYIAKKIGEKYTVEIYGVYDKFDDVDFSKLPDQFVLKCNHGSSCNSIILDKLKIDWETLKDKFDKWMETDWSLMDGFEFQYKNINRKIIAEKYIKNGFSNNLYDYKFHCFNGEPKVIEYIGDRASCPHEIYLDMNWIPLQFTDGVFPRYEVSPPMPGCFDELKSIASILSKDFKYVRVDLYALDNNEIKFGEMTFTPGSGKYKWCPDSADLLMGEYIEL